MRRPAVLLLALLGALTSCAVLLGPDIAATQAVVDRVLPGRFLVVSDAVADSGGYHRVVLAPLTDPDARLTVIFRPERVEDCGPGSGCETAVRSAVATAEEEAAEARTAVTAFTACGYPPVAVSPVVVYPTSVQFTVTVEAVVDDGTVERVTTDLDRCVDGWVAARADGASPWRDRQVGLRIEVVDRVGDPDGTAALPESVDLARQHGDRRGHRRTARSRGAATAAAAGRPGRGRRSRGGGGRAVGRGAGAGGRPAGSADRGRVGSGGVPAEPLAALHVRVGRAGTRLRRVLRRRAGDRLPGRDGGGPDRRPGGGAAGDLALVPLTEDDGLLRAPEEPGLR